MLCPAPQAKIGVHKVQLTIVYFLMYVKERPVILLLACYFPAPFGPCDVNTHAIGCAVRVSMVASLQ